MSCDKDMTITNEVADLGAVPGIRYFIGSIEISIRVSAGEASTLHTFKVWQKGKQRTLNVMTVPSAAGVVNHTIRGGFLTDENKDITFTSDVAPADVDYTIFYKVVKV